MGEAKFYETETTASDATPVRFVYDQEADILEIFFGENESATGVELTDYIILRLNQQTRRAISLTLLHFSILTERTEYGPRSYPLHKIDEVSEGLRELVLNLDACQSVREAIPFPGIADGADTLYLRRITPSDGCGLILRR
ncbi:MAG: DUF2283 domain-containing protein [Deltaproteobacteria bacterium]|nr:DUF2283 domain-containing protein [Deltaproteobacteria bacterium]